MKIKLKAVAKSAAKPKVSPKIEDDEEDFVQAFSADEFANEPGSDRANDAYLPFEGTVPIFVQGGAHDPFRGKPRIFLMEREFAIIIEDDKNLKVFRYVRSFFKKEVRMVDCYRPLGFYGTFYGAMARIEKCLEKRALAENSEGSLGDCMKTLKSLMIQLIKDLKESYASTSGINPGFQMGSVEKVPDSVLLPSKSIRRKPAAPSSTQSSSRGKKLIRSSLLSSTRKKRA